MGPPTTGGAPAGAAAAPPPPQPQTESGTPPIALVQVDSDRRIDMFLASLVAAKGSDLHIKAGSAPASASTEPCARWTIANSRPRTPEELVAEVIRADQVEPFRTTNEADFAYHREGGPVPVNALRQRGAAGMVFRHVSVGAPALADLGVPKPLYNLALEPRGIVLVTGPTSSGKTTTTLAAMIDHINVHKSVNIVTIEDPIEVIHHDKMAMVNQREVGVDTRDFLSALRGAMRQDPDVILIGEMRDAETVKPPWRPPETGHFVMSTLHTVDAQETVNRIIDFFPPHEQQQVRFAFAGSLRGILCQRLVKRASGRAARWRWRSPSTPAAWPTPSPTPPRPPPSRNWSRRVATTACRPSTST